ncbi:hypothetical protein B0I35DRAFT_437582 [Stachybotrys elegans]|uniref:DUF7708 domain-containing protein n=1 Tax=Stachybotrys elegans TaxID=80388 RepID=A0A8K0WNX5_9HYPO|nr:hypothetical protein B0I35DRAFT_437582 [Stachybotrys elegans]
MALLTGTIVSKALWKEADQDKERLFELMQQAHRKFHRTSESEMAKEMAKLRNSNWQQVMAEIEKTAVQWKSSPDKQSKVMVFIDKVGQHSDALQSWLELLPGGDYGSSISGAFKLLIGAASHYGKAEETVIQALSDIPCIMEGARRYVERYRQMRGQFLEQRTFELFRAILKLLCHIMQFFIDRKSKRFLGSLVKQDSYKEDLREALEEVQKRAQAVNEEAVHAQGEMVLNINEHTEEMVKMLRIFHQNFELLKTSPYFSQGTSYPQEPLQIKASPYDLANVDYSVVDIQRSVSPAFPAQKETRKVKMDQLLQDVHFDANELPRDIFVLSKLVPSLGTSDRARAAALISHPLFKQFLVEVQHSTGLLVNGNNNAVSANGVSPLSIVAVELARRPLPEDLPIFSLQYFCTEHHSPPIVDPTAVRHASSTSMMASLIGQLATQLSTKGITHIPDYKRDKIQNREPKSLCKMFRKLLQRTPPRSVVFCIIDEISWYETSLLLQNTQIVMKNLVELSEGRGDHGQNLKLLVTSQHRAREVSRLFPPANIVNLPESIETDDSADWTINSLAG